MFDPWIRAKVEECLEKEAKAMEAMPKGEATIEKIGKRWHIRLADGSLLKFKTGKTRYFNSEYMANFVCSDINEQEKKQISEKA